MEFAGRFGRRALRRLKTDKVIWLTSVDADGTPQPRPVWFQWDETNILIYSRPGTGKIRQIAANPQVALHFNSSEEGDDVVVFLGEARIQDSPIPEGRRKAYLRKYRQGIEDLEMTPESFTSSYRVAILVRLESLRGF